MTSPHRDDRDDLEDTPELLDADDALEEVEDEDGDIAMDLDDEPEEITLVNDSIAYFDSHKDSVFAIAQHPTLSSLIATGGSEGDGDDAPGKGYVFDTSAVAGRPVLPPSYNSNPNAPQQTSTVLKEIFTLEGHSDSINALAFTLPRGQFLVSAGLDGRIRTYQLAIDARNKPSFKFLAEAQEVPEVNWLAPCPAVEYPNTVALGASDGSVWVYTIDASDSANPLQIVQSYFMHQGSCTAGAWSPDGTFLATVSDDMSLYVWDIWGAAAAKGLTNDNGQTVVSLTGEDQRFEVQGGLFSVAIDPSSAFVAVGGAGGAIKIVSLPRIANEAASQAQPQSSKQTKAKAKGGNAGGSQAGVILASVHTQTDGIETLSFSPTQSLLAAGSVDGSIAIYDTARRFSVRRHIKEAHDDFSVVKVEFVRGEGDGWLLTSCGMDGVVRRWDVRGATPSGNIGFTAASGLSKEWRGHRGDGEGGGVLGFVQGTTGERIVTAGDDGIVLVFEA
ncbi:WD40-repeat-containing domain protein [Pseudomassariella vexata]|uniref:WD40-repeat-containing domain protein n=1 Tax=Pseudomassariella vexata TaxID=1141098 RepID=A0A1Y2D7L9_9PEZI|nr:WD40-repeat-containing domain protein [Pseudomassariella vexata]ORY55270.1 WD40-repeat-containing domain protein [Pseudomassariella vexata]